MAPRPARARRRSALREELTMKNASVPDRNAAAQLALIAVAERLSTVPPSAFENSPSTLAKISTKNTGIAARSTSVSGVQSCSRATWLVTAKGSSRTPRLASC
jgi:hypothetical protein